MNYINHLKRGAMLAIVAIAFAACDKVTEVVPIGTNGQTLVKLINGGNPGVIKDPVSFVNIPFTLTKGIADIRRDVANNDDLNKTMTVVIKDDTAAVTAANPAYVQMPPAFYTTSTSDGVVKVGGIAGTWTFTLNPGELAKQIYINIPDATKLDPSTLYGIGFTIISADAGGNISSSKTIVVEIGAKNKYDGIYTLRGHHNRDPYTFPYLQTMHMITAGATAVQFYWPEASSVGHPIGTGPDIVEDVSWYGAGIAPVVVFDGVTNLVTNVYNAAGPATPFSIYTGPESGVGRYDAPSKTMYVYWRYNANDLRAFMDTLVYKGPR